MKLTYANVTSTIALFAALSTGGAYAASIAANSVGTAQIRNGQVAVADLSPSVRSRLSAPQSGLQPPLGGTSPGSGAWSTLLSSSGVLAECDSNVSSACSGANGSSFSIIDIAPWSRSSPAEVRISGHLKIEEGFYPYDQGASFPLYVQLRSFEKVPTTGAEINAGAGVSAQCKAQMVSSEGSAELECPSAMSVSSSRPYVAVTIQRPIFGKITNAPMKLTISGDVSVEVR